MARWLRLLHRMHRLLGALFCALMLMWFASGAVMTFAGFPYYRSEARLRDSAPLPASLSALPPAVVAWLASTAPQSGQELRLLHTALGARWQYTTEAGDSRTVSAIEPYGALATDEQSARLEAERVVGARAVQVALLRDPDQWTVPLPRALFPLWRIQLDDAQSTTLYIAQESGELVQHTQRSARLWAWLGAIPHWIYPTILRKERLLWKQVVIGLASCALAVSFSGIVIGIDAKWRLRRRRSHDGRTEVRDPYLRWHQRIGLVFGLFVSTWLISGILSFTPFQWTRSAEAYRAVPGHLAGGHITVSARFLFDALAHCHGQLSVRALRYLQLASIPTVVCSGDQGQSRVVQLHPEGLRVASRLPDSQLPTIAAALSGGAAIAATAVLAAADDYYYPTHASPQIAKPYWRVDLRDADQTSYYFDPRLVALQQIQTRRLRWSRWLFQGLHSWDVSPLYTRPWLWRSVIMVAMALGSGLSLLALIMTVRRVRRRVRAAERSVTKDSAA